MAITDWCWADDNVRKALKAIFGNYRNYLRWQIARAENMMTDRWSPFTQGWRL